MKIHVNGTPYDIKNVGGRVWLDNNEITIKLREDEIIINGNTFHIDFIEHGEAQAQSSMVMSQTSTSQKQMPLSGIGRLVLVHITTGDNKSNYEVHAATIKKGNTQELGTENKE
jgi:hypothetical protein